MTKPAPAPRPISPRSQSRRYAALALYQWRFPLPSPGGQAPLEVECGIHVLWVSSETPGEYTAGGRFIQISRNTRDRIRAWSEGH